MYVAFYFQTLKIRIMKFLKIRSKILEVASEWSIVQSCKFQYKIFNILGRIKIIKSDKLYSVEIYTIHYKKMSYFVFFVA
jgi:hypothetical protein